MSTPGANPYVITSRLPNTIPPISTPRANAEHTSAPTRALFTEQTPATSINQPVNKDTSPGVQSSRQSNDINDSTEQFDVAYSEDHSNEGEPDDDLVPGNQLVSIVYVHMCGYYNNPLCM
jgi:hypothetical protein